MSETNKSADIGPDRYADMLDLPHHVSETHPQMSRHDRAAQFSPFRALTGHEQAIRETARPTDRPPELDEARADALNARLLLLQEYLDERPEVTVYYFQPDARKAGGACAVVSGAVKRLELGELLFADGKRIPVKDLLGIEGEIFSVLEASRSAE